MAIRGPYDSQSASGTPRTLGERIKALRVRRGLTQMELGDCLSTDQATISLWERDRAKPSGAALAGVAACFGVSVHALESGTHFELDAAKPAPSRDAEGEPSVPLPDLMPGGVMAVDLRTQAERPLEPMEAMAYLVKALNEGRSVWIVAK